MSFRQITTIAIIALGSFSNAQKGVEVPAQQPVSGTDTVAGCFSSVGTMNLQSSYEFNSQGKCAPICRSMGKQVGATYLHDCYCGTLLPNQKYLLNDSKCNEPCPGFDKQACGGLNAFTVYNTGVQVNVGEAPEDPSSSTSSAPSSTSTTSSSATSDVIETVTAPAESQAPSKNTTDTTGIAVGVVVGVVGFAALVAGIFFYMRRKRNAKLEEEHRRNAAVNAFISGGKPPSSSGMSIADSRMDPVMNRRLSDGSIADNQDYSRRILRVTNA